MRNKETRVKYFSPFDEGTLEQVLFRLGLLTFLFSCLIGIVQNFLVGVEVGVYFLFITGIAFFFFFYHYSFIKDIKQPIVIAFLSLVATLIIGGYFLTGGVLGSATFILITFVLFGFLFFGYKKYLAYVIICISLAVGLFVVESYMPEWVVPYESEIVHKNDVFGTILITILVIGVIMYFFKKHYDNDKIQLEENQEALEGMNQLLRKVSDEALSATKAKSDFLASMSHEIRTPLHGIIGMTDILHKTKLTDEQLDIVNSIQTSGNILLGLINDILDISKIEAERFELSESKFDIRKTLHDVLSIVRPKTSEKNVDLTFTITKEVPKYLVGDEKRLKQVLLNIAGNAAKFTSRGFVHIEMKSTDIKNDSVMMEFNVVDSGIGISEENVKYLFDPFFQGERVRKNNYGGTGLGLAITQKIVDLMKGKISVKSTEKLGTTFTIILPFAIDHSIDDTDDDKEKQVKLDNIREDLKILVAEDFEINQKVIRMMLEKLGLKADYAVNGREAVEYQRRNNYDLILMDLQMPEMDGIEATRIIRKEGPNNTDPVIIAMSANALSSDQDVCFVVGMNDFISKPATLDKVHEVLKKWESV